MKPGQRFNPHRMFTGIFIPDAVYRYPGLTAQAKLLYGRLARYAGENGEAYPAGTTLSVELGLSERQVFEHLSKLVESELIQREPRPGTSTVYHFIWNECFEEVVRDSALPGKDRMRGKPHQGSAENRTGGSAENRTLRESIEEKEVREEPPSPLEPKNPQTQNPTPNTKTQHPPPAPQRPKPWSSRIPRRERKKGLGAQVSESLGPGANLQCGENGVPSEVEAWNRIVTSGVKVSDFRWSMSEGANLVRCRRTPEFLSGWESVCRKAQAILSNKHPRSGFISFFWLIKADENWWRMYRGEYDNMAEKPQGKPAVMGYEQQQEHYRKMAEDMRRELQK